jgi:hypothetical protein
MVHGQPIRERVEQVDVDSDGVVADEKTCRDWFVGRSPSLQEGRLPVGLPHRGYGRHAKAVRDELSTNPGDDLVLRSAAGTGIGEKDQYGVGPGEPRQRDGRKRNECWKGGVTDAPGIHGARLSARAFALYSPSGNWLK